MGALEVAELVLAQQVAQAAAAFCTQAASVTTNAERRILYQKGSQLFTNLAKLATWGEQGALVEFSTVQTAEKNFVQQAQTLPPIT